ncbi:sugar ABC transporter substrate-binding protein [Haloterrigena alkaliphila]|uniref:Sugar ABC transporter substrate-binding protein n=1 Tax=Haloterrigena alkaliphila TaxID=2816475 RepID=A0A8A2VJQ7_9EURY|nr:sugar ABC transporter substrate-binding protein [Haloterrigena alkaliphila]QSX00635.1 sugar ABC transporter substrate-binding protein [Haloterrigena alkaliphila]
MSTDSTPTEVFEDVDPDPDAVLAEFDVESPEDVADAGGAHDPIPDGHVDADDTTAAELFADLAAQARETQELEEQESDESAIDAVDDSFDDESPPVFEEFEAAFVGEPAVTGREDDELVESTAAELNAVAERVFTSDGTATDDEAGEASHADEADETVDGDEVDAGTTTDGLTLVGPDPTPTRVDNDAFSRADADGD